MVVDTVTTVAVMEAMAVVMAVVMEVATVVVTVVVMVATVVVMGLDPDSVKDKDRLHSWQRFHTDAQAPC